MSAVEKPAHIDQFPTDGEIRQLRMENIEKAMSTHLLLIDDHNSHFTKVFLDYTQTHKTICHDFEF